MIRCVEIKGLRGIREGKLDDLPPLAILVGPNGSGKSTVLSALLIGGSPDPRAYAAKAAELIQKRIGVHGAGRWVIWRAAQDAPSQISVWSSSGSTRVCCLELGPQGSVNCNPYSAADARRLTSHERAFGRDRSKFESLDDVPDIRLVGAPISEQDKRLHRLYTKVVNEGRASEAKAMVREVLPEVTNVEILTEGDAPIVHLVFKDHSVPVVLAGDGILMALRLILELASCQGGVVLLEEPEVHQHPGAIRQSAKAILAAVRREIQVILSTHSLDLIDALLAESGEEDLQKMAVYRLHLEQGVLKSYRLPGPDVRFARSQIEDDLR